ncbi:MAG: hypothetical protein U1E56_02650 [Bauldia sp.]
MPPISLAEVARKVAESLRSTDSIPAAGDEAGLPEVGAPEIDADVRSGAAALAMISDPARRAAVEVMEQALREDLLAVAEAYYRADSEDRDEPADAAPAIRQARTAAEAKIAAKLAPRRRSAKRE